MAPVMSHKASRARAVEALRLRARGWTWLEVAAELDFVNESGARMAVNRLIAEATDDPQYKSTARFVSDEAMRMQYQRLLPLFETAVDDGDVETAVAVAKELRATSETRTKLTGIGAPKQVEHSVAVEFTNEVAAARQRMKALPSNVLDVEVIEVEAADVIEVPR